MKSFVSRSILFAFLFVFPTLVSAEIAKVYLVTPQLDASLSGNRTDVLNQLFESAFFKQSNVELLSVEPLPNSQCRADSCLFTLGYQRYADFVAPYTLLESDGPLVITMKLLDVRQRRTVAMESITVAGGFGELEAGDIQHLVGELVQAVPRSKPGDRRPPVSSTPQWSSHQEAGLASSKDGQPAQDELRLILLGGGNFNLYMMDDVNDEIAQLRGAGLFIDEISSGGGFHAGVRIMPSERLQLGLEYRSLNGSTTGSDYSGSIRYDVSANVYEMILLLRTSNNPHADLFLGFGAGQYVAKGFLDIDVPGYFSGRGDIEGQKIGIRPIMELQMIPNDNLRLGFFLSYRFAKISDLDVNGTPLEDYSLDYSGVNIGFSLMFVIAPNP